MPIRLALIALMIVPTGAMAQNTSGAFFDGNELYDRCQNSRSFARGFISGANDAYYASSLLEKADMLRLCSPNNSDLGQITDVVCKHLSDNPAQRHYNAALLVRQVITETYPCSE